MLDWLEFEISRYKWDSLPDCSGTAKGVPDAIRGLLSAQSSSATESNYWLIENRVVVDGQLFESAIATTAVLVAALVVPGRPPHVRISILEIILQIVLGESHPIESARGLPDLGKRCRDEARAGLWLFYREMLDGGMDGAREVLEVLDPESGRLEAALLLRH
jgi:hypothetical protein